MMRGFSDVEVITPKVPGLPTLVPGALKFGQLKALACHKRVYQE